jgi:hypothetical protein
MFDTSRLVLVMTATLATVIYAAVAYRFMLKRKHAVRTDVLKMFPVVLSILAAMMSVMFVFVSRTSDTKTSFFMSSQDRELRDLSRNVSSLEDQLKGMEIKLATLSPSSPTNSVPQNVVISEMQATLSKHDVAINQFEGLVISDAEKLITLPLMQRDFKNIQNDISTVKERVNDLSSMITETSGQNRWVIGTLAFGMLALVLPVIKSMFVPNSKVSDQNE